MHGSRYQLQFEHGQRQGTIVDRGGNPVINNNGAELRGAVLDHKSITHRNFGTIALGLQVATGIEQALDPGTGAMVEYVSDFWNGPINRFNRSIPPILNVAYAHDLDAWGETVRDFHRNVKGFDEKGRKFHALHSDSFYWDHDTFKEVTAKIAEHYSPYPFTEADREQLQLESNAWYMQYSMPMGIVPEDWTAYKAYRKDKVERLEMTPTADRAINMLMDGKLPIHEFVPKRFRGLAHAALMPVGEMARIFGIGEISEDIKGKFAIPFSDEDRQKLEDFRGIARLLWKPLPDPFLYQKPAYEARLRETGGRHKNTVDHLAHTALSGVTAIGGGLFRHVRSAFSTERQELSSHIGDVDFSLVG